MAKAYVDRLLEHGERFLTVTGRCRFCKMKPHDCECDEPVDDRRDILRAALAAVTRERDELRGKMNAKYWESVRDENARLREQVAKLRDACTIAVGALNLAEAGVQVVFDAEQAGSIRSILIEALAARRTAGEEKCEGCGKPATRHDSKGVPLCKPCHDAILTESDDGGVIGAAGEEVGG